MAQKAWIVTTHYPNEIFHSYQSIKSDDIVIAVDEGLSLMPKINLVPTAIIGDFDSLIDQSLLSAYPSADIMKHPGAKNSTDTELAIMYCMNKGISEIVICNDLQGRIDHVLGLIQNLLMAHRKKLRVIIDSGKQLMWFVDKKEILPYPPGSLLSLLSYSKYSHFESSSGLEYDLGNLTLHQHLSRGISNIITAPEASIKLLKGSVLACVTVFD